MVSFIAARKMLVKFASQLQNEERNGQGDWREIHLDLPRPPIGGDTHKGAMIEMMGSLVSDGVVERISEEVMTSFISASICPILLILHKDSKARFPAYSISLCQFRASRGANHRFEIMIGKPAGRIEVLLQRDEFRVHNWLSEEYPFVIGCLRAAVGRRSPVGLG